MTFQPAFQQAKEQAENFLRQQEVEDLHEGVLEFLRWRVGIPLWHERPSEMPLMVALVFDHCCRVLGRAEVPALGGTHSQAAEDTIAEIKRRMNAMSPGCIS